jgi:hypothetical protein
MATVVSGNKQPNELSGFGFPEKATAVEACADDDGALINERLVTDLYCQKHGRFLPLSKAPTSIRVIVAIIASLLIYGSFELAAQLYSQLPVFAVYVAIFFGFVALPLRHFVRTAIITSLIWIIASIIPIISRDTSGHLHVVLAAAALVSGIAILTIYAIANAPSTELPTSLTQESRIISRVVAAALIIAAWSAAASLALHYESYILPGNEREIAHVLLIIALISFAVGALIVSASSIVIGVRRVNLNVRTIPKPRRPIWVTPTRRNHRPRTYNSQHALALAIDTFIWTIYLIAFSVGNALVTTGRIVANCIEQVAYVLAFAIVTLTNVVIRFAVLTARWAQATIESVVRLSFYAASIACRCIFDPIASVLIPVSALVGAPWLVMASAKQTHLYLLHGSHVALRNLFIMILATTALLLGTWIILANQHPRESFRSFGRSAPVTVAYGLVVLFFGGWLLAIPGYFGYGHIHAGLITLSLTGVVIIIILLFGISRLIGFKANKPFAPLPVVAPSSPTGGRVWTITVALVMIAGATTGLVILAPWRNLPLARPTGLAAATRTTNTVTISWSTPASGPLPSRYVILQNGKAIGSLPGTATSYRATGLAPATSYTYQLIAVRGASRSSRSSLMTVYTSTPRIWTAILTGQWVVHYTNVKWNGMAQAPQLTTDTWTFAPKCGASQCPVALTGTIEGAQFIANLRRSDQAYTSQGADDNWFYCNSSPNNGNLTLKIVALSGRTIRGQWVVFSWSGTMNLSTPGFNCVPATITATINAVQ